jgi:hypothetical protein
VCRDDILAGATMSLEKVHPDCLEFARAVEELLNRRQESDYLTNHAAGADA